MPYGKLCRWWPFPSSSFVIVIYPSLLTTAYNGHLLQLLKTHRIVCLSSFGPSDRLENYLEAFLWRRGRLDCVREMHKTKYLGCDTNVPTVEDIEARIALLRKRRGEEEKPEVVGNDKEEKGEGLEERRLGREPLDGSGGGGTGGSGEGVLLEDDDEDDELPPPLPGQEKDKGVAMASSVALPT